MFILMFILGFQLLPAGWEWGVALLNFKNWLEVNGGTVLNIMGVICLIGAGIFAALCIFTRRNIVRYVICAGLGLVIGGSLLYGGIALAKSIGNGSQNTIRQMGGGMILPSSQVVSIPKQLEQPSINFVIKP